MGVKIKERPEGSGTWWIFIDHHGKRKAKKIGRDESLAKEVGKRIEAKLALGEMDLGEKKATPKFKEYAEKWLGCYVQPILSASTYERYGGLLKQHVYPTIGALPIDEIKRSDVRDLLLGLIKKEFSKSTVQLVGNAISGPFNYALDEEIISTNPTARVMKALHSKEDRREFLNPLTHEQVRLFLKTTAEHFREYYAFFLCAFRTGMRLGELLGLQWGDVDWNGKFIEVKRSYKRKRTSRTKTGRIRHVDMSDQLIEALRGLFAYRKKEGLKMGLGEAVEGIFYMNGQPMEQNYIRRQFKRVLQKAGLREIRFHDIRHTFASLLLTDGVSPVYVKEQMGHKSIQMTVDIYGHLIPSSNRAAVNRMDDNIKPQLPATQAQPKKGKAHNS
jgi:integrase